MCLSGFRADSREVQQDNHYDFLIMKLKAIFAIAAGFFIFCSPVLAHSGGTIQMDAMVAANPVIAIDHLVHNE